MIHHAAPRLPTGMELEGPLPAGVERVLTPGALGLVVELVRTFRPRVEALLERRREVPRRLDAGERPAFLAGTAQVREAAWEVAPLPPQGADLASEQRGLVPHAAPPWAVHPEPVGNGGRVARASLPGVGVARPPIDGDSRWSFQG